MENNIEIFYEAAMKYTKIAGALIREKISGKKSIQMKTNEVDLVTETDQEVEKILTDNLSRHFPDHKFIGEESVAEGTKCVLTDDPTWIIDPIDGTLNFIHKFPHTCISIALFVNKEPQIGIVYNPILEQLFSAKRGQGTYLNGERVRVSEETSLNKALVIMEFGGSRNPEKVRTFTEDLRTLLPIVHGMRGLGTAALDMAMVACGGVDVFLFCGIHIWDIVAGELLITEAGGVVIDPAGGPFDRFSRRVLAASSEALAQEFSKKIIQFYPSPRDDE